MVSKVPNGTRNNIYPQWLGRGNGQLATNLMGVLLTRVMPRSCYLQSHRSLSFTMIISLVHQPSGDDDILLCGYNVCFSWVNAS
jgi:hypothetical protein